MANDFIGYLPKNLIQNFFTTGAVSTFTFSNLPGVPATTTFQHVLRDIIFITPNFGKCGLGFSMITYRDTLSFGLIVDKTLIPQKQAAQDLLDDVLEEIRMMYDQFKRNM
ncbi:unnamed protein product [Acanthoscelides obtectus]|nr:unnamed protein product [Acanthoscelides obtectus]CAK1631108.1 hypothetical protein AOBTE_LOCUS6759 [Acanthoscelides obtectus]